MVIFRLKPLALRNVTIIIYTRTVHTPALTRKHYIWYNALYCNSLVTRSEKTWFSCCILKISKEQQLLLQAVSYLYHYWMGTASQRVSMASLEPERSKGRIQGDVTTSGHYAASEPGGIGTGVSNSHVRRTAATIIKTNCCLFN